MDSNRSDCLVENQGLDVESYFGARAVYRRHQRTDMGDMPVTDAQLDVVVLDWNRYAEGRPESIDLNNVLVAGLEHVPGSWYRECYRLALRLVEDRSVGSMEMTMGHLYRTSVGEP